MPEKSSEPSPDSSKAYETFPGQPGAVTGFSWLGRNIGIKDDTPDFAVAYSEAPCAAAAVFTRNNFPGAPVIVGREHAADGQLQAVVVNSKNSNVATGPDGVADARRMCDGIGKALGIDPALVLPSSTGVIGVPLPIDRIEAACLEARTGLAASPQALEDFARAIMTTDTRPKMFSARIGGATLTAVAKGAGMIEPNMATMLSYAFTDAAIAAPRLQALLRRAVECSFNRVSVDSDTSTSDTVALLANGLAGPVDEGAFEAAFTECCVHLAKEIARDGEGAGKLIELSVVEAPSQAVALTMAKAVINSPLVKTAIHGADPNWGRFVMAVGKVFEHPVPLENLRITFATAPEPLTLTAGRLDDGVLERISDYLRGDEVNIVLALGQGSAAETVWGCDLSAEYVRINAEYTT